MKWLSHNCRTYDEIPATPVCCGLAMLSLLISTLDPVLYYRRTAYLLYIHIYHYIHNVMKANIKVNQTSRVTKETVYQM